MMICQKTVETDINSIIEAILVKKTKWILQQWILKRAAAENAELEGENEELKAQLSRSISYG
jgi:hypothetical protein